MYESDRSFQSFDTWIPKFVQFDDSISWTLVSGTASLENVIRNADGLFINMGTTTTVGSQESGVDNVIINGTPNPIPEPTTIILLGTGIVGLAGFSRRKFRKR